jgi:putative peptide zinc metalloprotease protein
LSLLDQQSSTSSDKRPIKLRARNDLVLQESIYQGEISWIVKDPVAMKYFRIREPEKIALEMVDGNHSYHDIKTELELSFPEETIRMTDVHLLINSFHKNSLLISNASGQAAPLQVRRNKELKQKGLQLLMSVMSLRFPGVDPERFLTWLYPKVSWFFTKTCFAICLMICFSALMLVTLNMDEFYRKLPEFEKFFDLKNIFFMASIMIVTKTIHELGHGLMCKHFGGECHEIGFMLLVLTPAMYCNTSDSWILPNKWHRIAIGAAGMYIEIVLAAICTFVWWHTQPGVIHYMSLNIIFLCSVSTLIFNANPLLRYDGYYMLSDYLEIPNLGNKSRMSLVSKLRVWCLGMKPVNPRQLPQKRQFSFAIYAVAAFVYRWFVMLMIFWFLIQIFEPYGLAILGHLMIAFSIVGMIGIPLYKMVKFFVYPGRFREVKKLRFAFSMALLAAICWMVFAIPVPHNVSTKFVVQPVDAQKLYVSQPGTLLAVKHSAGDAVKKGDVIAVLENEDLEIQLEQLKGLLASSKANLTAYQIQNDQGNNVAREILSAEIRVKDIANRINISERMIRELTLVADRDGVIIPAPNILSPSTDLGDQMTPVRWNGTPMDSENANAFLQSQTLFCLVGDPKMMKAMLVIDQADAKFVQSGQPVKLMLDEYAGQTLSGDIQFVSRDPLELVPRELSINHGGSVATKPTVNGNEAPLLPAYEASVLLNDVESVELLTGFRGVAKVRVGTAPLGKRLLRYLSTVVNFR